MLTSVAAASKQRRSSSDTENIAVTRRRADGAIVIDGCNATGGGTKSIGSFFYNGQF